MSAFWKIILAAAVLMTTPAFANLSPLPSALGMLGLEAQKPADDVLSQDDLQNFIATLKNEPKRRQLIGALEALQRVKKKQGPTAESHILHFMRGFIGQVETFVRLLISSQEAFKELPLKIRDTFRKIDEVHEIQAFAWIIFGGLLALVAGLLARNLVSGRLVAPLLASLREITPSESVGDNLRILMRKVTLNVPALAAFYGGFLITLWPFHAANPLIFRWLIFLMGMMVFAQFVRRATYTVFVYNREFLPQAFADETFDHAVVRAVRLGLGLLYMGLLIATVGIILGEQDKALVLNMRMGGAVLALMVIRVIVFYRRHIAAFLLQGDHQVGHRSRMVIGIVKVLAHIYFLFLIIMVADLFLAAVVPAEQPSGFMVEAVFYTTLVLLVANFISLRLHAVLNFFAEQFSHPIPKRGKKPETVKLAEQLLGLDAFLHTALYIFTSMILLQIWGLRIFSLFDVQDTQNDLVSILSVFIIFVGAMIISAAIDAVLSYHLQPRQVGGRMVMPTTLAKTLSPIARRLMKVVLWFTALLMTLNVFSISVLPLLAGASGLVVTIGLAAPGLIRDVMNGILILMEDNIAVGDAVVIGDFQGDVEDISVRSVKIRHRDGTLNLIPFSEIKALANKSRDYTLHFLEVFVGHHQPLDKIYALYTQIYDQMSQDPSFSKMILDPIWIRGVDRVSEYGVHVLATVKTVPDPKQVFFREFNRRIQDAMIQAGIEPPTHNEASR